MAKISMKEQEELQNKIAELEQELETANATGAASNAEAALEAKRKVEDLTAQYESKLKKSNDKLEKLQA